MPTIHAFVISWPGQEHHAERIAGDARGAADHVTVLHSCPAPRQLPDRPGWVQLVDAFYGGMFRESLALNRGEVMLHLHADARTPDWTRVVRRCREAYLQVPTLGIWVPDVDYTPYPLEEVRIGPTDFPDLHLVAMTDSIVWSVAASVAARLRQLDLRHNSLGWGIDRAAIAHCVSRGLLVLRDTGVHVSHPAGTGYRREEAEQQMLRFLTQLAPAEQVALELVASHVAHCRLRLRLARGAAP